MSSAMTMADVMPSPVIANSRLIFLKGSLDGGGACSIPLQTRRVSLVRASLKRRFALGNRVCGLYEGKLDEETHLTSTVHGTWQHINFAIKISMGAPAADLS